MKFALGAIGALVGLCVGITIAYFSFQNSDDQIDMSAEDKVAALQRRVLELEEESKLERGRAGRSDSTLKSRQQELEELRGKLKTAESRADKAEAALAAALNPEAKALTPAEIAARLAKVKETFGKMSKEQLAGFVDQGKFMDFVNEIKALGDEGLDYALGLLNEGTTEEQVLAARILGLMQDSRAMDALADAAVNEENEGAANAAARALMTSDGPGAVEAMRKTLANSPHETVKVNTLWGLCRHGDETAVKETLAYLGNDKNRKAYRQALAQSAFLIDKLEMRPVIEMVVSNADAGDRNDAMRMAIGWYGRNHSPENRRSLEAAAQDTTLPEAVRQSAQEALQSY